MKIIAKRALNICTLVVIFTAMLGFLEEGMKKSSFQMFVIVLVIGLGLILALNYIFFGTTTIWNTQNEHTD